MSIKKIICNAIVFLLSSYIAVNGRNFYIDSSNGKDANNGLSVTTAWKTIDKVNSFMSNFKGGDSILFKRGNIFVGQIEVNKSGETGNPIVIGAYGIGTRPVISGASLLRGWTNFSGQTMNIKVTNTVKNVYVNNAEMTLARYPNTGWLFTNSGNGLNGFVDNELTQTNGYWNNSTIHIRTINWVYEIRKVNTYIDKTVSFDSPVKYNIKENLGYYFDNVFTELDNEKEWFYNAQEQMLYFIPQAGNNPETSEVYGSIYDFGIKTYWKNSHIVIRDLKFTMQADAGIWFGGECTDIKILNNEFINCNTGMELNGNPITNTTIDNNYVEGSNTRGMYFYSAENSTISNNTFKNCGMVPGQGGDGVSGAISICIAGFSKNTTITHNTIENSGYIGIRCDGEYCSIKNNIIKNSMLTLADGAAIYSWGTNSHHNNYANNFIDNVVGNTESCPDLPALPMGIYFDEQPSHSVVSGNTITNTTGSGIFIHNSSNNQIANNTTYNCGSGITFAEDIGVCQGNKVTGNVFYSLEESQIPFNFTSATASPDFGTLQNNYYCNPGNPNVAKYRDSKYVSHYFGLNHWKNFTGRDTGSKESLFRSTFFNATDILSADLLTNGSFDNNINAWGKWPTNCTIQWTNNGNLDGGCLKFIASQSTQYTSFRIYANDFAFLNNTYYQLNFSVYGTKYANMLLQTVGASPTIFANFPIEAGKRNDYSYVFKSGSANSSIRSDFEIPVSAETVYLDNFHLYEVGGSFIDPKTKSVIFSNPSEKIVTSGLQDAVFQDLNGNEVSGSIDLLPWQSKILVHIKGDYHVNYTTKIINHLKLKPNPVNRGQNVEISFEMEKIDGLISIYIYDIKGVTCFMSNVSDINVPITINTNSMARGTYFVRLKSKTFSAVKKLIVL